MGKLRIKIRHWLMGVLLYWAFQVAPKDTKEGKQVRDLIAGFDSLKD